MAPHGILRLWINAVNGYGREEKEVEKSLPRAANAIAGEATLLQELAFYILQRRLVISHETKIFSQLMTSFFAGE